MQNILNAAPLLGGLTALWFLYDKRAVIFNWLKLYTRKSVNPLSLPDKEFEFVFNKAAFFVNGEYLPVTTEEKQLCLSLINHGVLKSKNGAFMLTGPGKRMLAGKTA